MGRPEPETRADAPPHCAHCGDVIGVYERLVRIVDGRARTSSRAAEPHGCRAGEICFHLACYPHPVIEPVD